MPTLDFGDQRVVQLVAAAVFSGRTALSLIGSQRGNLAAHLSFWQDRFRARAYGQRLSTRRRFGSQGHAKAQPCGNLRAVQRMASSNIGVTR